MRQSPLPVSRNNSIHEERPERAARPVGCAEAAASWPPPAP